MSRLILGKGKVSNIIKSTEDKVLSRSDCDITDVRSLRKVIGLYSPEVIINCAAKTNLEFCEDNKKEAYMSNTHGIINLLSECQKNNIKLVHISSGCLFDGNHEVSTESSDPTPAVWYTWTKKWADEMIQNFGYDNFLILRPRQLISATEHPSNMLTKFASMNSIGAIDEPNSLTCIEDFSLMIDHLLGIGATGVYNCANPGLVSPLEIAQSVKEFLNPNLEVKEVSYEELLKVLPNRRVNTILSIEKLIKSGYNPRPAKEALAWCLKNYNQHL